MDNIVDKLRPSLRILVGAPGSGKSTWRSNILNALEHLPVIISTDDYIEQKAKEFRSSYSEVFKTFYNDAEIHMNNMFNDAIKNNLNIIVDRTNMTKKSRRRFLSRVSSVYYKQAVVFDRNLEYLTNINQLRVSTGRDIPLKAIEDMVKYYQEPSYEEGFDSIITISIQE